MNETKAFSLPTDGNSSPPELLGFTVTQIRWSLLAGRDKSAPQIVIRV